MASTTAWADPSFENDFFDIAIAVSYRVSPAIRVTAGPTGFGAAGAFCAARAATKEPFGEPRPVALS